MAADLTFTPPPTIEAFMKSNQRVRMVRGPVGSGKSSGMVMEMLRRASMQAPDPKDGIRRTRGVIVRNTMPQLKSTSLKTILELLGPIIDYRASDHTIWIKQGDIETEWIMMPLDTEENIQRLLSLDLTFAWASEFRELKPEIVMAALSRCGRFPSMMHGGPTWYGLMGETNSFDEDSPWNKILEEGMLDDKPLPSTWGYFIQPGARDVGAENRDHLVPGYYEDLIESNTPDWVAQYIDNQIAPSLSGEAVFRSSYRHDFHGAKEILRPVPGTMVVIGMDFARQPAAVFTQLDPRGRLLALDEVYAKNMGIENFINTHVRPILARPEYTRLPIGIVGDPTGVNRSQVGEESVFGVLKRLGFACQPAQTNSIDPRLRSVEKWLLQQRDGGAALLVSKACPVLRAAMQSRYRYAKKKTGELQVVPDKNHPWSDVADALQYAVLGHSGSVLARLVRGRGRSSPPPPVSNQGWT